MSFDAGPAAHRDGEPATNRLRGPGDDPVAVAVFAAPTAARLRDWDDLVRSHPAADVAQLSGWTRVRALAGYRAMYLLVDHGDRLAGGAQVLVRRIPGFGALGYVPYGPLVAPSAREPVAVEERLADALAQLARSRFRMLFVQPPEGCEHTSEALLARGFRHSEADIAPAASLHVDLGVDEAQLRRNLSKRLRTWTNAWESRGVMVRQGGEDDLPLLARLLAETAEYQGFTPFGLDYLRAMYRELAPAGHLVVFIGEASGRPVAMMLLTGCGAVLKTRLVGLDRSDEARRLNVPAAVDWTAMKWAKHNGYLWFDFGGLLPSSVPALLTGGPVDMDALAGPDRYKARFGGQVFRYPPPVELIPSPVVRASYDLARRSPAGRKLVAWAQRMARSGAATRTRPSGQPHEPDSDHEAAR
jgi:lipid II:glycine glycyltransferase (peptidoglycan interpeptide bridge formation enzyme)